MQLCAGIGKSIAKKLAAQQLSVVLVALQDSTLDATHAELRAAFPNVTFRKVNAEAACSSGFGRAPPSILQSQSPDEADLLPNLHLRQATLFSRLRAGGREPGETGLPEGGGEGDGGYRRLHRVLQCRLHAHRLLRQHVCSESSHAETPGAEVERRR